MDPLENLEIGGKYSKKDLSEILEQPTLSKVREGIYYCNNSESCLLFVDLEKDGKDKRFHFDDYFEGEYFHWDSQTTQHIDSPKIQNIIKGDLVPHLLVRINQKIKSKTQPFVYCGRCKYETYEKDTSRPVKILYQNIDYDDNTINEDLIDIYLWNPLIIGKGTKNKIVKKGEVSKERKSKYLPPNETERRGLVTSRVGQGFYRQQILEKWGGRCPITKIDAKSILISSHIKPWKYSNDEERLDVENGILLSPNLDSLFDRFLISFLEDGKMIISTKLSKENRLRIGINYDVRLEVTKGMEKYLNFHREKFYEKQKHTKTVN